MKDIAIIECREMVCLADCPEGRLMNPAGWNLNHKDL
jgi:hypothetical protein